MKILLKHVLRSAGDKPKQIAIIIITVILTSMMIFTAFSLYDIFFNLNIMEYDRVAQGADMLLGDNGMPNEYFSKARLDAVLGEDLENGEIKSITYFAKFGSVLKTEDDSKQVLAEATYLADYLRLYPIEYVEKFTAETQGADVAYAESGSYNIVIIGESFARKTGLQAGSLIELYVPTSSLYAKFLVKYVAANKGIFSSPADLNVLVDLEAVGNRGQISAAYINFNSPGSFEKYEELFAQEFPAVKCGEGNGVSEVRAIAGNNTLLFGIALVFLVATMMLILFSSYLIIAKNSVGETAVFKACGASPASITGIMLLEVGFYGLIGGLIGLLAGRAAVAAAGYALIPLVYKAITYKFWKYAATLAITVAVTLLATLAPIRSLSKKTIRELSSTPVKHARKVHPAVWGASAAALAAVLIGYFLASGTALLILTVALAAALAFFAYCSMFYLTLGASKLIGKLAKGGAFRLSALTVRRNGALHTVSSLTAAVISLVFLITEIVAMVNYAVTPFNSRYSADYVANAAVTLGNYSAEEIKSTFLGIEGVSYAGYFGSHEFYYPGSTDEDDTWTVYGTDNYATVKHTAPELQGEYEKIWNDTANAVILNNDMALRLGLSVGDEFSVYPKSADYGSMKFVFKVVGIDKKTTQWDQVGICKYDMIAGIASGARFLIDTDGSRDEAATFRELRQKTENFNVRGFYLLRFDEWAYATSDNFAGVSGLLVLLQIALFAVAAAGLINISVVTAYDRRAELKIYRLNGLTDGEYIRLSLGEGLVLALSAGGIGLAAGLIFSRMMPVLSTVIDKYIAFPIFPLSLVAVVAGGIAAFTLLWVAIAYVGRKNKPLPYNSRLFE